jgi:hypothetical protein
MTLRTLSVLTAAGPPFGAVALRTLRPDRIAVAFALAIALVAAGPARAAAPPANASAGPDIAFDQLDLPVQCVRGCAMPMREPGRFDRDYAEFIRAHPDYRRQYEPGLLYRVAAFGGETRVETQGIVTICNAKGNDMIVLDEAHKLYYHSIKILQAFYGASDRGCRSALGRDYYHVTRLPGSFAALAPIVVDGIRAQGRRADYDFAFFARPRAHVASKQRFRITTYTAALPEPCPVPRAVPIMTLFGNTCGGDKRFLIFRSSLTLEAKGSKPAFMRGDLGIVNERGHIRALHEAGDLFSIPSGYRDACAHGGRDTLGLCLRRKLAPPEPVGQ